MDQIGRLVSVYHNLRLAGLDRGGKPVFTFKQ